MGFTTVGILLGKSRDDTTVANNLTLIIAAVATFGSLGVLYEALRLSAMGHLWSLSKADVAGWLAQRAARKSRLSRLQSMLLSAGEVGTEGVEGENAHLSAMLELSVVGGGSSGAEGAQSPGGMGGEEDGLLDVLEDGDDGEDVGAGVPSWLPVRVFVRLAAIHGPLLTITGISLFVVTHYDVWGSTTAPTHIGQ